MNKSTTSAPTTQANSDTDRWMILSWRYWRLMIFFARTLFSIWLFDYIIPHVLGFTWIRGFASSRHRRIAIRFRKLAIQMGGVMIKLGQFLSARVDIMPPVVIEELSGLQDEVEPVEYDAIVEQIQQAYGKKPDELFESFQREPEAAASLGQVHLAGQVLDNETVDTKKTAVKVQRPNIRKIIETDLAAVKQAVGWLKYIGFIRRRADLDALYDQFSTSLRSELNYKGEAKNAEEFAENMSDHPGIDIPRPIWDLTTDQVLVLEQVKGIKVTEYAELEEAGISRREVAQRLLQAYLQQIYMDGTFHADPHPGNIFVQPDPTAPPAESGERFRLVFVDFGMVGRLPEETRDRLREVLVAVLQRDFYRIVRLAKELNFLLPEADDRKVVRALETLFDRYYGLSMGELAKIDIQEIEGLLREFRDLLYQFPFQVPQDFILLGRCLGILNGLTTGLDPDFSPVDQIENFTREYFLEEESEFKHFRDEAIDWVELLGRLPRELENSLRTFRTEPLTMEFEQDGELIDRLSGLEQSVNRISDTILIVAAVSGGFFIEERSLYTAWGLWGASGFILLRSWWYRFRR